MNCGRMQNFWEIHRESDLAAEPRARNIFAPEHAEIESHAAANGVLTSHQSLELASAQVPVIGKPSVNLGPERQPRSDVDYEMSHETFSHPEWYAADTGLTVSFT